MSFILGICSAIGVCVLFVTLSAVVSLSLAENASDLERPRVPREGAVQVELFRREDQNLCFLWRR